MSILAFSLAGMVYLGTVLDQQEFGPWWRRLVG
jgi:hypothetical protein